MQQQETTQDSSPEVSRQDRRAGRLSTLGLLLLLAIPFGVSGCQSWQDIKSLPTDPLPTVQIQPMTPVPQTPVVAPLPTFVTNQNFPIKPAQGQPGGPAGCYDNTSFWPMQWLRDIGAFFLDKMMGGLIYGTYGLFSLAVNTGSAPVDQPVVMKVFMVMCGVAYGLVTFSGLWLVIKMFGRGFGFVRTLNLGQYFGNLILVLVLILPVGDYPLLAYGASVPVTLAGKAFVILINSSSTAAGGAAFTDMANPYTPAGGSLRMNPAISTDGTHRDNNLDCSVLDNPMKIGTGFGVSFGFGLLALVWMLYIPMVFILFMISPVAFALRCYEEATGYYQQWQTSYLQSVGSIVPVGFVLLVVGAFVGAVTSSSDPSAILLAILITLICLFLAFKLAWGMLKGAGQRVQRLVSQRSEISKETIRGEKARLAVSGGEQTVPNFRVAAPSLSLASPGSGGNQFGLPQPMQMQYANQPQTSYQLPPLEAGSGGVAGYGNLSGGGYGMAASYPPVPAQAVAELTRSLSLERVLQNQRGPLYTTMLQQQPSEQQRRPLYTTMLNPRPTEQQRGSLNTTLDGLDLAASVGSTSSGLSDKPTNLVSMTIPLAGSSGPPNPANSTDTTYNNVAVGSDRGVNITGATVSPDSTLPAALLVSGLSGAPNYVGNYPAAPAYPIPAPAPSFAVDGGNLPGLNLTSQQIVTPEHAGTALGRAITKQTLGYELTSEEKLMLGQHKRSEGLRRQQEAAARQQAAAAAMRRELEGRRDRLKLKRRLKAVGGTALATALGRQRLGQGLLQMGKQAGSIVGDQAADRLDYRRLEQRSTADATKLAAGFVVQQQQQTAQEQQERQIEGLRADLRKLRQLAEQGSLDLTDAQGLSQRLSATDLPDVPDAPYIVSGSPSGSASADLVSSLTVEQWEQRERDRAERERVFGEEDDLD